MKKLSLALALATALASLQIAYGNMAAPSEPDMGAAVTLEENESLAVRSEVLVRRPGSQRPIRWRIPPMSQWLHSRCSCRRIWSMPAYR